MSPSSSSVLAPPPSILAPSSSSTFSSSSSSDLFSFYNNCQHEICIAEGTIQRDKNEVHGKDVDESCAAFIVERCHDNSFINPLDPFEEPMMPGMYTILPLAQCKQDLQGERHSEIRQKVRVIISLLQIGRMSHFERKQVNRTKFVLVT